MIAADFADPHNARIIFLAAGGLALVGVCVVVATVWWWRSSRTEHPALAPLEVMAGRTWEHASDSERRRQLDGVRPIGSASREAVKPRPDQVDLKAHQRSTPKDFNDLRDLDLLPAVVAAEVSQKVVDDAIAQIAAFPAEPAVIHDEQVLPVDKDDDHEIESPQPDPARPWVVADPLLRHKQPD